jgi:7-cyano-7-deazaguanine synthase
MKTERAIAIVSGGLDSVTLAYYLHSLNYTPHLLSVDYGQRHVKELRCAALCAEALRAKHTIVDLRTLRPLLSGSALTDGNHDVPDGHYAAETMRITVVPNRNAILLSIAYAAAVAEQADIVAIGVHAGDHFIYPDCRPDFLRAFAAMQVLAVEGFADDLSLLAPFERLSKADIVALGATLDVPFADTWSCYKGGDVHCGSCGTCVERKEAFTLAGVFDPTRYEVEKEAQHA